MEEAELAAIGPLPYHDKEYDAPGGSCICAVYC